MENIDLGHECVIYLSYIERTSINVPCGLTNRIGFVEVDVMMILFRSHGGNFLLFMKLRQDKIAKSERTTTLYLNGLVAS